MSIMNPGRLIPAEKLDMSQHLGRGIQVHFKNDDWAVNYRPVRFIKSEFDALDQWVGFTSGGLKMNIFRHEIELVKVN